jgi:hypothetical protein
VAQVLVFHKVRGEIVGPPKMVNSEFAHPVAASDSKPAACGQQTLSIAQSLRTPASSFQGATRHAGYQSRGKIRCY